MMRQRWPSLFLLGLLLVIAALAAWDYIEVWRLDRELARIASLGEPTTTRGLDTTTTSEEETAASRYYRAAVALVNRENWPGQNLFQVRLGEARRSNTWPDDLISQMRQRVTANEDALLYLDKAAALEFKGFHEYPAMSTYVLDTLLPIAELRTNILAIEGRSDEAGQSLYSALRLQRTAVWSLGASGKTRPSNARRSAWMSVEYFRRQLQMLASRTQPSAKNLALLAEGFAALDDDDLLLHDLLWLRAASRINVDNPTWWLRRGGAGVAAFNFGESIATSIQAPLYRPFLLHQMNGRLRDYGDLIAAQAGKSWPDKLDALTRDERDLPRGWSGHGDSVARELVLIRSARTIIAIEQYRRANAERLPENWDALSSIQVPLIDPFSGQPLKMSKTSTGYVVYSVGTNRRDDGGRNVMVPPPPAGRRRAEPTLDVGISVTLN